MSTRCSQKYDYLRWRFSSYSLQVWFAELPLEALWLANIYDVLGGSAVWYLGVCSFAADITAAEERASRIARFGGAEQLAFILGNALSPVLFTAGGYELAFRWSTVHSESLSIQKRFVFAAVKLFSLSCHS